MADGKQSMDGNPLPKGWQMVKLGDVAIVIAGQAPKGENYNKNGNGLPFYQGKKDYGKKYLNSPTVWTTKITRKAIKDDILMSVRAPVGALNIATEEICIGRGLAAIRAKDGVSKDCLYLILLSLTDSLKGSSGAIYNSINKEQIEAITLPLPPLEEQERIVAKLDAIFDEINHALATTTQKQTELANLKNSILNEAFKGNLLAQ